MKTRFELPVAISRGLLAAAGLLFLSAPAGASTLTYSGTLPDDNDLFTVPFSLSAPGSVTMSTSGVSSGDFFPVLWLFNSTETTQIDKDDPPVNQDASMTDNLAAGAYMLILSTFDQHYCVANTICNGVVYSNTGWSYNGNFFGRSQNFSVSIVSSVTLNDLSNSCSTTPGNCYDAPTPAFSSAPEPVSLSLAGLGLSGLLFWRKLRRG